MAKQYCPRAFLSLEILEDRLVASSSALLPLAAPPQPAPMPHGDGGTFDSTLVVKPILVFTPPGTGAQDPIPIEIIALSLQSTQPIQVPTGPSDQRLYDANSNLVRTDILRDGTVVDTYDNGMTVATKVTPIPNGTMTTTTTKTPNPDGGTTVTVTVQKEVCNKDGSTTTTTTTTSKTYDKNGKEDVKKRSAHWEETTTDKDGHVIKKVSADYDDKGNKVHQKVETNKYDADGNLTESHTTEWTRDGDGWHQTQDGKPVKSQKSPPDASPPGQAPNGMPPKKWVY